MDRERGNEELLEKTRTQDGKRRLRPSARNGRAIGDEGEAALSVPSQGPGAEAHRHQDGESHRTSGREPLPDGERQDHHRSHQDRGNRRKRPAAKVIDDRPHLADETTPAHGRKSERLVELHRGDENSGPGHETDEHRLRKESHQRGAPGKSEDQTSQPREQSQSRESFQTLPGNEPVRAQEREKRAQDQETRGVRGPGHHLRALAHEGGDEPGNRRRRDSVGRREPRHHGVGEALGKADESDYESGEEITTDIDPRDHEGSR